jgi:hypothetical protein
MLRSGNLSGSKPAARRWTPGDDDKLCDMLDIGKTADEIAVDLNSPHLAISSAANMAETMVVELCQHYDVVE